MPTDLRWWTYSARGRRRDMQDAHVVARCERSGWCVFAVADGHGGRGAVDALQPWVAPAVVGALSGARERKEDGRFDEADVARRLQTAVADLDTRLYAELRGARRTSGTTLVLAAFHPRTRQLFVANVGDSRAVLADARTGEVLLATEDHTAKQPGEARRVRTAGGAVERGRVGGVLAPSRALGDFAPGLKRVDTAPAPYRE